MMTLVIGTNRLASNTEKIADYYSMLLKEGKVDHKILNLQGQDILTRNDTIIGLEKEYLLDSDKFIFFIPEYNGSFPGIFKLLLDNSDIKKCWWYKKALLVGLADGRGGNLRGIDHLTNILHYLKMNVHFSKVAISKVGTALNNELKNSDSIMSKEIKEQLKLFVQY